MRRAPLLLLLFAVLIAMVWLKWPRTRPSGPVPVASRAVVPAEEKLPGVTLETRSLPAKKRPVPSFSVPLPRVELSMPALQVPQLDPRVSTPQAESTALEPIVVGPALPWFEDKLVVPQISVSEFSLSPVGKRLLRDVFMEFNGMSFAGVEWQGFREDVLPKWRTTPQYYGITRYQMPTVPGHY